MFRLSVPFVVTALVLQGCATGHGSRLPAGSTETHTTIETPTRTYEVVKVTSPDIFTETIPASLDQVWASLPAAYGDLHMPVNGIDPASHLIDTGFNTVHGRFAGSPLSKLVDCGSSALGMQNADHYAVRLQVQTQLSAASGGGTQVRTLIQATAKDPGTSTDATQCTTRGRLERQITQALGRRVK